MVAKPSQRPVFHARRNHASRTASPATHQLVMVTDTARRPGAPMYVAIEDGGRAAAYWTAEPPSRTVYLRWEDDGPRVVGVEMHDTGGGR